jgi:hypothetical protein
MKPFYKIAFPVLVCALIVAGFAVMAPKAVKAAVATLVQVVNTAANPVINQDKDNAGRGAFQTTFPLSLTGVSGTGVSIPPGTRLVIDYVSFAGSAPSAGTQPYIIIYSTVGSGPATPYQLVPTQSTLAPQQFDIAENVKIYADSLFVSLAYAGSTPPFMTGTVSISGHLVTIP